MIKIRNDECALNVEWVADSYTIYGVSQSRNPKYPSRCWICGSRFKPRNEVVIVHTKFGNKALHADCWQKAQDEAAHLFAEQTGA